VTTKQTEPRFLYDIANRYLDFVTVRTIFLKVYNPHNFSQMLCPQELALCPDEPASWELSSLEISAARGIFNPDNACEFPEEIALLALGMFL
jgi:hypothetical protein